MKAFDLVQARTVEEAAGLLPVDPADKGTMLLAGGQDLLTEMKEHLAEPDQLVNLKGIPGLDAMSWQADGSLVIGAMVTVQDLEEESRVRETLTALHEAAVSVGSPQIRSVGTVGGNLNQRPRCWYFRSEEAHCLKKGGTHCYAAVGKNRYNAILGGFPSYIVHPSDLATALVALEAEVTLVSPSGERTMSLADYFTLPREGDYQRETVRLPNEVMTSVRVPAPPAGMRSTFLKMKERESYDWALSAVALCLWTDGSKISDARIVLGGVAPKPWRCASTETLLKGRSPTSEATANAAGADALKDARALSDNGYKIPLTQGLLRRALQKLGA